MERPLAVIFGAGPGIGLAVAERFARGGHPVAVVARPDDPLERFQAALAAHGVPALALAADLARPDGLDPACAAIEQWRGLPGVLVYNASGGAPGPLAQVPPEALQDGFRLSCGAALAAAQWALGGMRRAGRGTLLFTGGGLALAPKPGLAAASLGKAALRSLALALAGELAPEGIHAATVTIRGFVQPGTPLSPERVAEVFWELHGQQPDEWEAERMIP
jgi:NAD(P)-dependent dehydrogenase (short-subunit alcohol dehydrogenase family)